MIPKSEYKDNVRSSNLFRDTFTHCHPSPEEILKNVSEMNLTQLHLLSGKYLLCMMGSLSLQSSAEAERRRDAFQSDTIVTKARCASETTEDSTLHITIAKVKNAKFRNWLESTLPIVQKKSGIVIDPNLGNEPYEVPGDLTYDQLGEMNVEELLQYLKHLVFLIESLPFTVQHSREEVRKAQLQSLKSDVNAIIEKKLSIYHK